MATATDIRTRVKAAAAAAFCIEERTPEEIFTPEDFNEEQRQIARDRPDFAHNEILPAADEIEAKDFDVTRALLQKAGDLGLMATDMPEEYGGLAMDKVTSAIVADQLSALGSFSVAFSAHVGIGTLPIVWYGTTRTEAEVSAEARHWRMDRRLRALRSLLRLRRDEHPDPRRALGRWQALLLNGEKMWITNARLRRPLYRLRESRWRKVHRVSHRDATPRALPWARKNTSWASAARPPARSILSDCKVPVDNLLGEVGKGHHIAFNILNIGRFKLGAACVGGAAHSLANAIRYAKERKAFGKTISDFGLIQQKTRRLRRSASLSARAWPIAPWA